MTKGLFIAFEGIDGSGKSTQCQLLHDYCITEGIDAIHLVEPSTGPVGKKIREILGGSVVPPVEEQLELFLDDRADDVEKNITPALSDGKIILMDRYCFSNAAYQGAMGLSWENILKENRSRMFPFPHHVFFIDISVERALERISLRNGTERDIFEKQSTLKAIYNNYHAMIDDTFSVIDGSPDEDTVFQKVKEEFLRFIS